MSNSNSLAKNHTLSSLLAFAFPNMIMMLFLSMYTIVDGSFVSIYAGTTALSSVNMTYPAVSLEMAIAIMLATGGGAIIAKQMGENKVEKARQNFSFLVMVEFLIGLTVAVLGNIFMEPLLNLLGATEQQFDMCRIYLSILFAFAPCFSLQITFQTFFVTAGKPLLGLSVTIMSGITNIVLDYVFIVIFDSGIAGAAIATGIGYSVSAIIGVIYFTFFRKKELYFVKSKSEKKLIFIVIVNFKKRCRLLSASGNCIFAEENSCFKGLKAL